MCAMPAKPNILWICADDYTPSVCGAYGNSRVRTPHLDRLAAEGLRFDRAFCACPLSTPSRQAFWTGRYPRSIGVTLSPTPLPADEVTLPALLNRLGYETAAFGKTHFYAPRSYDFDLSVDLGDHRVWLARQGVQPLPRGLHVLGPWLPFSTPASVWLNSACRPYGAVDADMAGTFFANQAANWLEGPHEGPFFLYVSFYETHSPFWFPIEFRGRHDPRTFPIPETGPDDLDEIPPVFRDLSREDKQGILAAYHTSAEFLDKNVGLVLDALERCGRAADTLVLFTSDHGYLLGQHGRFEKHCCFEPAVRSALLLRWPGRIAPAQTSAALVELVDLVPTILEACGGPIPPNLHGRSLTPLLHGQTRTHRDHVVVEYADNEEAMIRTERWKLIYCTGRRVRRDGYALDKPLPRRWIRLYDLLVDPEETTNRAGEAAHASLIDDLLAQLVEHMRRTDRHLERVPDSRDPHVILEHCLPPAEEWARYGER
jgi:arylsulfatase A-like enzyme